MLLDLIHFLFRVLFYIINNIVYLLSVIYTFCYTCTHCQHYVLFKYCIVYIDIVTHVKYIS